MFRWKRLAATAVVAALALTGCSAGGSSSGGDSSTLTLGVLVPATTFEAQAINFANSTSSHA